MSAPAHRGAALPRYGAAGPRGAVAALAVLLAAGASLLLRLPFLRVPLTADEAGYAYVAYWFERGLVLYRDLWFDRPQAIFGLYAAVFALVGRSTEAIRLGAAGYNAATVLALAALAHRLGGRRAAVLAAWLYAAASVSPALEGFTANGELFMNLPAVVAVLLAARGRPEHALRLAGWVRSRRPDPLSPFLRRLLDRRLEPARRALDAAAQAAAWAHGQAMSPDETVPYALTAEEPEQVGTPRSRPRPAPHAVGHRES